MVLYKKDLRQLQGRSGTRTMLGCPIARPWCPPVVAWIQAATRKGHGLETCSLRAVLQGRVSWNQPCQHPEQLADPEMHHIR